MDAGYWVAQLRQPVRFADARRHAGRQGVTRFVEVGPHPVLTAAVAGTPWTAGGGAVAVRAAAPDDERRAPVR